MNATERYLAKVSFWLPRSERADIISSLREALDEQVQARETLEGKPLSDAAMDAVLRRFGPPALAASRYHPQIPLVDGALMHVFVRIMVMGLSAIILVQAALVALALINGTPVGPALAGGLGRAAVGACIGFTCTTLIFAALTRFYSRPDVEYARANLLS